MDSDSINYYDDSDCSETNLNLDDDDDDDCDDVDHPANESALQTPSSCKVITKECLLAAQKQNLQRAMDLLNLRQHHARTLLIHYRWDVDKVTDVYVNKGKDRLYEDACLIKKHNTDIISPNETQVQSLLATLWEIFVKKLHLYTQVQSLLAKLWGIVFKKSSWKPSNDVSSVRHSFKSLCEICMEEVPIYKMTTMDCGHCFCDNCWTEHFVVKINEGQSRHISCMAYKCNVVCDEEKIRIYVNEKHPELVKKFDRFLLESYIEDNKMVKWCPSVPHCGNAIRVDDDECREVECVCGHQFCFSCSSEAHSPCSCHMWALWTHKFKDELLSVNWMLVHTKNCPTCLKPIEKDGGCNIVKCTCGQEFCWLCGNATRQHKCSCGRLTENHDTKMQQAKAEHKRTTHYHDRYIPHTDSLKAEINLKNKLKEKISGMKVTGFIKDYTWVIDGVDRLIRSRQILKCSYPFAYYIFGDTFIGDEMTKKEKNIKRNLFEDQQQQFEGHTEKLSFLLLELEPKLGNIYFEEKVKELRMKIITLSKLTDVLCKNLYDFIDNEILINLGRTINIAPYRSNGADKAVQLHY